MLIDAHIHYDYSGDAFKLLKALEITNADACCLQSLIDTKKINQNFDSLYAKDILNKKTKKNTIYVNCALNSYLYHHHEKMGEMPKYIERMIACGADGVKLIEGKPTSRKRHNIPNFDDPLFDPTFSYLEKEGISVTWHVNDPEEFWDEEKVPFWAKRSGWFYGDGTYVNNIDQYNQIFNLLKKHPKLKICFAHFFFLSNDLDKLSKIFDTYPNISIDITPGVELFENMSKNIENAKAFFNKYYDRIIYGTDITVDKYEKNQLNEEDALQRKQLCHDFLSKDKVLIKGNEEGLLGKDDIYLNCLGLDKDKVDAIEYKNFLRLYPNNRKINSKLILEEIQKQRLELKELNLENKELDEIEAYFKNNI